MADHMPTAAANFKNALQNDFEFWADNADQLNERFNAWLANNIENTPVTWRCHVTVFVPRSMRRIIHIMVDSQTAPSGPITAADGTPLKKKLAQALFRSRVRAVSLVVPLFAFVMVSSSFQFSL